MRFTLASAIFVVFAAMLTIFTVEAAAINRREPLPVASPYVEVRVDAGSDVGIDLKLERPMLEGLTARDFSREARDFSADTVVESRAEAGNVDGNLVKRLHARDWRSIH
ncbi:hypothetical protein BT96DRAFT_1018247 [Gymnopus androsaceus JB14]|uniref:Uncharacterized protein n=1 Tax=Gymnopus androsaceus JB14 TaxID=1447944 RepID=A0A6A4HU93_9AGAR|nr:hypothetical protein BT96DRAFT_1018247 [Gymnopus androsaceus JB14]